MKKTINAFDYAKQITTSLHGGILLNTHGEKFNSMVIGWGHLGVIWEAPTFMVYVRQSRYTKPQLDKTGVFSVSAPLQEGERLSRETLRVFGSLSGRDVNKADYVTLEEGRSIAVPAIKEYPLTLECRVIYRQDQRLPLLRDDLRKGFYGRDESDFHTMYIGEIVDAYIITDDR